MKFAFRRRAWACVFFLAVIALLAVALPARAELLDTTPRTAVMSAYRPEWTFLRTALVDSKEYTIDRTLFVTGTIEGKPVVLFLSGVSMVNAAMTTQMALDHFAIERIVFSGAAGGVDPGLTLGDIVVPEAWSEYLESVFARESEVGNYTLPSYAARPAEHFGMIFPQPVEIANAGGKPELRTWFAVDPALLALARTIAVSTGLKACAGPNCLARRPKIVVGGNGVSGPAFVDNKEFRSYARKAFAAEVLDMESAAVAHVAYVNAKPFIAFRSLSDLAGGETGESELQTSFQLAADNAGVVVRAFLKALP
jgi:adenosylhomocysteine nucleosidase